MSKIEKLHITGIRSFDVQTGQTIVFRTPLTLIVGVNGSGKTTIVECLKYITTGDAPPGAKKGGAFVHDPKLLGEKEVPAQVKLQFRSIQGQRGVVTRNLLLTVTKTTRTMKTVEGSLLVENNGEKSVISSRVAGLDQVLPGYLGVSAAVLDNVIFCHQEESTWPMSEPTNLKKKFDEIFEAQKYIKAIENIKTIRKKHNIDLGQFVLLEQHAKEDRDRANKARKKTETLHEEIENLRTKCHEFERRMERAREAAEKAWKRSESYGRILNELESKRGLVQTRQEIIDDIKGHLKETNESDEWLERTLQQFDATLERYEEERQSKREQWLEMKDELAELQRKLSEKDKQQGKFESEKDQHERHLERRRDMVSEAATKHQMRGYDDLTDDSLVEEFLYKIGKVLKDQNSALQKARTTADVEQQQASSAVNRLNDKKGNLRDKKVSARNQIISYDKDASGLQRQVDQIQVDEGSKAIVETQIEDTNAALNSARDSAQTANWDSRLTQARQQLRAQEDDRTRLNSELVQGTKRAGEVAKLAHLKQELRESQRSLQTLMNAHADRLKSLLSSDWTASTVESVHRSALEHASRELINAEKERDAVARDIEQIQFKQKTIKEERAAKSRQAAKHLKTVQRATDSDISEYESVLKDIETALEDAQDSAKGLGGLADFLNSCQQFADTHATCKLCTRAYKNKDDPAFAKFKVRLEGMIKKASANAEAADLAAVEERHKQIVDVNIDVVTWKKLTQDEIPALDKEVDRLSQQKDSALKKAEKYDKTVEQRQSVRKELETISRTVASIAKCQGDSSRLTDQIEELSEKQSQQGNIRTLEDIQEEIAKVTETVRNTDRAISQTIAEQDASRTQIHQLEIQSRDLKNKMSTTASQLEKKADLIARVEEVRAKIKQQNETIDQIDQDIEQVEPEIAAAKAKYDDVCQRWKSQLDELTQEAAYVSDTVNNLNLLNEQITAYIDRGGANQLTTVKREIKQLEQEVKRIEASQVQLTKEISKVEETLRDNEITKRQYSDNLRFRQETRTVEQLRDEIAELESHNAEADRDRFDEENRKHTDEMHKCSAAREGCLGEMKSRDVQLKELIDEYNTDLKDAPKRFKEAHIKVETTKAAVEDLQRYGTALDKAIMKYHSLKMEEINEIIGELWKDTYQGTDVDKIFIRSDEEMTDANGNVKKTANTNKSLRRQYNYRVTMEKDRVEMDMRGRCSAGQKVLACIIIRLALAEVFSSDCGIIALDEPTTNLDRENIQGLAISLHNMIKTRRRQKNFQLIVITHDETFLKYMDCADFTETYYEVSRDKSGDSKIEEKDILELDK